VTDSRVRGRRAGARPDVRLDSRSHPYQGAHASDQSVTLFSAYSGFLASLPERPKYEREDLLVPELLVESDDRFRVFYSPFDWFNPSARVIILGITPGWTQMELACRAARGAILSGAAPDEVCRSAKLHGSFAGPMRANLVKMLDDIGLHKALDLKSSADLFETARHLLHTASAIRYPVFKGNRNYTGNGPRPAKSALLMKIARKVLVPELDSVANALIVPLGKSVEELLEVLGRESLVRHGRWLSGFPHPSGANGHRARLFKENRRSLRQQVRAVLLRSAV
jgi:hypothetical protein